MLKLRQTKNSSLHSYCYMKIDHVAIAVNDVAAATSEYQKIFGLDDAEFETVETEGVRVGILRLENCRIELMQPTRPDSPISKFLAKNGEGLHHMALQTGDIHGEVDRMKEHGARFLGDIRAGSEGTKIIFIHPKSLHGVLTELCALPERV